MKNKSKLICNCIYDKDIKHLFFWYLIMFQPRVCDGILNFKADNILDTVID